MRILLIEDDIRLAQLVARALEREQHTVEVAHDGELGLEMALRNVHDIFIIDWMLPKRDGPTICRAVRLAKLDTHILMMTARTEIEDRVHGLDGGADDYLTKPFALLELTARVRALGRRTSKFDGDSHILRFGDLIMNTQTHTAARNEAALTLSITEWKLLEFLMRHPNQALSRQQILDSVWSFERDVQPKMVDIYISYLRRALNVNNRPNIIESIRGVGYKLTLDASPAGAPSDIDA